MERHTGMEHREDGTKRHAVRKDDPDSPLYWVGNEADWREVRRHPHMPLECPERCGVELISVERHANQYTPRFFRIKPPGPRCDHWKPRGLGGPESAQHDWLKNKLAEIARDLGYSAVVEHWPTRADVYVESSPPFCLEIQLRSTSFTARTQARGSHGASVCWLIRDGLDTPSANEALARAQAVRFRVVDGNRRLAEPWHDPPGSGPANDPRVEVFKAIVTRPRDYLKAGVPWFRDIGYMDARQFLDEILSGRRRPYHGWELGLRQAAWALDADVTDYRAFCEEMAARRASRPPPQPVRAPAPRPVPLAERTDDVPPGEQTDGRAMIRGQAAADLAEQIRQVEARIETLEEHKVKLALSAERLGSTATGHLIRGTDLELHTLTKRLAILRRQELRLTEFSTVPPPPLPSVPSLPDTLPSMPIRAAPLTSAAPPLPARQPWWHRLVRRKDARAD